VIVYIVFFFLLIVTILRFCPFFRIPNASPWLFPFGFAVKTAVSFFFLYVYSYHYGVGELTADASSFFVESKILNNVFYESPVTYFKFLFGLNNHQEVMQYLSETTQWDYSSDKILHDVRNILKLHSIIHFVSFNQIIIHAMVVVVISLLGIKFMILAMRSYIKISVNIQFLVLLLMPNVLFWTSGILKEPLLIFSIGFFLYVVLRPFKPLKKCLLLGLSILFLLSIKPYLLFCIAVAMLVYFVIVRIKNIKTALFVLFIGIGLAISSLLTKPMEPVVQKLSNQQFDFINIGKGGVFARADTCIYIIYGEDMPSVIVNRIDSTVYLTKEVVGDYIQPNAKKDKKRCIIQPNEKPWKMYYDGEFSGSYIETTPIEQSPLQLVKNIPQAMNNVLLRPLPSDPPHSVFKWFSILDAWGVYTLLFTVLLFFRRKLERKELNFIIALCVFSLVLTLLIGWTTPILGAIIRYKIPIQIAIMFIILILFNPQKLRNG
jgi:hypothetical protein